MNAILDNVDGLVSGHAEGVPLVSGLSGAMDEVIDYESTGRRETAAKALHLMARGAHISGFVLRPDDGLSDVAIVSNGATRFLPPGEFQWLMHESGGRSILAETNDEATRLREELVRLRERVQDFVWSYRAATGHEELPQCPEVRRVEIEGAFQCLEDELAITQEGVK
jgi:hypothetical protein